MRKCLAALVATAVCALQAQALAFHVHVVPDHGRGAGHTHGPAIHHHQHATSHDHVRFVADDDVHGAITLLVPAATPVLFAAFDTVPAEAQSFDPPTLALQRISDVEFRSHGPPSLWRPSYRGPPVSWPS